MMSKSEQRHGARGRETKENPFDALREVQDVVNHGKFVDR
jgi:hypothetical protein